MKKNELKDWYRREAARLHPDHGGDAGAFAALRGEYERLRALPCAACGGSGRVVVVNGWHSTTLPCPDCEEV